MRWDWKTFDKKPGLRAVPTSMGRAVEGIMAKWAACWEKKGQREEWQSNNKMLIDELG